MGTFSRHSVGPIQVRKVYDEARRLGLDGDELSLIIQANTGKVSLEDLTSTEIERLRRHLLGISKRLAKDQGAAESPPAAQPGSSADVIRLASQWQLETIACLLSELGLAADSVVFLALVARICGRSRIRTSAEAAAVIAALKRQEGAEAGSKPAA